jgi:hypothetical protein
MLELAEEFISTPLSGEEPAECCEWRIHPPSSIDPRSDLESDDIRVALDLLFSAQELSQSY